MAKNSISESNDTHVCFPIPVPSDDPFWKDKNRTCMSMARSFAAPGLGCELEFRQQVGPYIA